MKRHMASVTAWLACVAILGCGRQLKALPTSDGGSASGPPEAGSSSTSSIRFVQVGVGESGLFESVTKVDVTLKEPSVAGDLIVVAAGWYDTTSDAVESVTDTSGNTYRIAAEQASFSSAINPLSQTIWYASGIATAPSNRVSVTFKKPAASPDVRVVEYSGLDPKEPFDRASAGKAQDGAPTTDAMKVAFSPALLFSAGVTWADNGYLGAGPDFAVRSITPFGNIAEDRTVDATGVYQSGASTGSDPGSWLLQLVAFH
jgi:hypothetical protein